MENTGLKRGGELILENYRDDYPSIYEKEKEELLKIYKDKIKYIDHVGSTSIKNIKSKPIIDILIQTDDLDEFIRYTEENVESEIYTVKKEPTRGGDYLIRKEENEKAKALIHVYRTGDIRGITSIMFRDYLNNHEEEKKDYEALKLDLYSKYKNNRNEYTNGKDKYIKSVIKKAIEETELEDLYDINFNKLNRVVRRRIDEITESCYVMMSYILIKNNNKYLLEQATSHSNNTLAIPGGHILAGEDGLTGLKRELKEELNLENINIKHIDTIIYPYKNYIFNIYLCEDKIDITNLKIQEGEIVNINWYSKDEIFNLINENKINKGYAYILEKYI